MKVKTLRAYLIGLPEEFDDFNVNMTKHTPAKGGIKRAVEPIHSTIARWETKEIFLLDKTGSDFFDAIGKVVEENLKPSGK